MLNSTMNSNAFQDINYPHNAQVSYYKPQYFEKQNLVEWRRCKIGDPYNYPSFSIIVKKKKFCKIQRIIGGLISM